ncbi:DUF7738 domain-containing protein [Bergeyella zoohelcum]|nr:hypothetical protein [Bergeyella zoohelcum]
MKLLGIGLVCLSCGQEKLEPLDTAFQFTECGAFYKGKPLPFGKPIAEWEKIFGKNHRNNIPRDQRSYYNHYMWDDLGIMVEEEGHNTKENKIISTLYIFFSNLDSPAGKNEKLKFAGYSDYSEAMEKYEKKYKIQNVFNLLGYEEGRGFMKNSILKEFFIYPYKTYAQSVTIDGAEVRAGMSLKELNKNRKSLGLNKFTFRDQNMNMINERGQTKGDKGEYWDDRRTNFCPKQGYYFYNSVQYSDYELEFIRVGYRTREDDENGKFYPFW